MELLTLGFLNIFLTAVLAPAAVAGIATGCVWWLRPAGTRPGLAFLSIFAFAVLGFVTGKIMGNSREAAVGTVVPAVLTLLGGVSVYVIGVKGPRVQGPVAAMVMCFALSLFIGSYFGSQLRYEYETFWVDRAEKAKQAMRDEDLRLPAELKRLENFMRVRTTEKAYEAKYGISLSGFESALAKPIVNKPSDKLDEKK